MKTDLILKFKSNLFSKVIWSSTLNYWLEYNHIILVSDTAVGHPIATKKCANPTNEEVNAVHKEYMDALVALFEEHKTKYGIDKDKKLVII